MVFGHFGSRLDTICYFWDVPTRRNTAPRVRKPGMSNSISDDTLRDSNSPDVLATLTPDQLKRRRDLRRQQTAAAREVRRKEAAKSSKSKRNKTIYCIGRKTNGDPCMSKHVIGSDYCSWHMTIVERERLGVRDPGEAPRQMSAQVKAPELLRQIVEMNVQSIIAPYFEGLGLELVGYDEDTGEPVVRRREGGGLKLYGESKDGDIVMTPYDDIGGMVAIAEKLLDRIYGKPKQSTTIEGGMTPIKVQPVRSEERAIEVAAILAQARALPAAPETTVPHEGRRRAQPSTGDVIDLGDRRDDNLA